MVHMTSFDPIFLNNRKIMHFYSSNMTQLHLKVMQTLGEEAFCIHKMAYLDPQNLPLPSCTRRRIWRNYKNNTL